MQPELPTAAEPRFGPNAREKLRQHIERVVLREDPSGVEATRSWKDELQAVAGAGGNIEQSAPAPSAPLPVASPQQTSPPPPKEPALTDIEKMDRVNSIAPPQHYLKGPPEPWERQKMSRSRTRADDVLTARHRVAADLPKSR